MVYHARNRSADGVLLISVDGSAFRNIEEKWLAFKREPRNVRLLLVANNVNPFGEARSSYSLLPVYCYPWKSIDMEHIMLTIIFSGINLFRIIFFSTITSHLSCLFHNYILYFFVNLLIYVQLFLIIMSYNSFNLLIYVLIMYCMFNQLGKF